MDSVRIDKWLWAVRQFKTRSLASDACKGGRVKINQVNVKPSREVKVGDEIEIVDHGIKKRVRVLKLVKNRVGAKLVSELMLDVTSSEELEKLEMINKLNVEKRIRGAGRPTKKDRRMIDKLKGQA